MSFMNAIHHFLADEETSKTVFLKYFLRVPICFRLYIKMFYVKMLLSNFYLTGFTLKFSPQTQYYGIKCLQYKE